MTKQQIDTNSSFVALLAIVAIKVAVLVTVIYPEPVFAQSGSGPLCGSSAINPPDGVSRSQWRDYRCASRTAAGVGWSSCFAMREYTSESGRGCPGSERCCPESVLSSTSSQYGSGCDDPGVVLLVMILGLLYFLPSFVAWGRHVQGSERIFIFNLLASWCGVGWVLALYWALTASPLILDDDE